MENPHKCNYYFTRKRTRRVALVYLGMYRMFFGKNCDDKCFSVLWVISTGFGVVLAIFNGLDNDLAIYGCGIWSSFPSLPGTD